MKTDIDKAIAAKVKMMREELGISQRNLATIIGTSHSFVYQVEKDNSLAKYSAYHLFLIAEDFDCEFSDLFPPKNPK